MAQKGLLPPACTHTNRGEAASSAIGVEGEVHARRQGEGEVMTHLIGAAVRGDEVAREDIELHGGQLAHTHLIGAAVRGDDVARENLALHVSKLAHTQVWLIQGAVACQHARRVLVDADDHAGGGLRAGHVQEMYRG